MSKSRAYSYLLILAVLTFAIFSARFARAESPAPAAVLPSSIVVSKTPMLLDAVSSSGVCGSTVATPGTRQCIGKFGVESIANDTVKNFKTFVMGGSHMCGIDERGVRCWNSTGKFEKSVQEILAEGDTERAQLSLQEICVPQKDKTIHCHFPQEGAVQKKEVFGPFADLRDFQSSTNVICVLDGNRVICEKFRRASDSNGMTMKEIPGATALAVTWDAVCVVSPAGLDCLKSAGSEKISYHVEEKWKSVVKLFHTNYDFVCGVDKDDSPSCLKLGAKENETIDQLSPELVNPEIRVVKFKAAETSACAIVEEVKTGARSFLCGYITNMVKAPMGQDAVDFQISATGTCTVNAAGLVSCFQGSNHAPSPLPEDGSEIRSSGLCRWNNSRFHCTQAPLTLDESNFAKIIATSAKVDQATLPCVIFENRQGLREITCLESGELTADLKKFPQIGPEISGLVKSSRYICAYGETTFNCVGDPIGGAVPPNLSGIKKIFFNDDYACASDEFGFLCWGRDLDGRELTVPNELTDISAVVDFGAGQNHVCAISREKKVVCWGKNAFGQLDVPKLTNPTSIVGSGNTNCASSDEGVTCWGARHGALLSPAESKAAGANPPPVNAGN